MNKNSPILNLSEGKTLNYLIPVILCAILATISFVFFWPLGILLAITCISLASVESGLEFDPGSLKYRKYNSLFGSRRGKWMKIPHPESFHIRLSVDSHSYRTFGQITSPAYYGRNTVAQSKTITYDVLCLTRDDSWITIYQFSSYKLAVKLAQDIRELTTFEVIDHIALKLEENQQKRMNRRR